MRFPHSLLLVQNLQAVDLTTPAYAAGTTYAVGALVLYGALTYSSLQAGNVGHQPDISPTWWAVNRTLVDEYNQPVEGAPLVTPFFGWLQPRASVEIRQANDAGAVVATHTLFARPALPATKNDRVQWNATGDARVYLVEGDPRDAGGAGHHLELDLRQVTA